MIQFERLSLSAPAHWTFREFESLILGRSSTDSRLLQISWAYRDLMSAGDGHDVGYAGAKMFADLPPEATPDKIVLRDFESSVGYISVPKGKETATYYYGFREGCLTVAVLQRGDGSEAESIEIGGIIDSVCYLSSK